MKRSKNFPFESARRLTAADAEAARKAIGEKLGQARRPRRGRPPLPSDERAKPVAIRLSPRVIQWAKREAKKQRKGYQTFINDVLKRLAS